MHNYARCGVISTRYVRLNGIRRLRMKTFNIIEASAFLGAHKETVRRLAVSGEIPGVKIGRSWRFIEQDLADYMRNKYSCGVTSQGADLRSKEKWRFTKEKVSGGYQSHIMDREYNEVLGLAVS